MIVYKFGGASIKDSASIKQMAKIVRQSKENVIVVVSAIGKTTNKLEQIARLWFDRKDFEKELNQLIDYHQHLIRSLFEQNVPDNLNGVYENLHQKLRQSPSLDFNYEYDQIVSNGELISTKIIASYFNILYTPSHYIDIREVIKTDRNFKRAEIIWNLTKRFALERFTFENYSLYITQGFIASATNNQTTTLGREGSDYSAAILANVCNAQKLVVWKDVPGIMNADPQWFKDATKIDALSYNEAIELTYYGAKVIHPKTIKPLQEKNIPLFVNSFKEPGQKGSVIKKTDVKHQKAVYIRKENQLLISIRSKTFKFVTESDMSSLFRILSDLQINVQLTQMSAATFSICVDKNDEVINGLLASLQDQYSVRYNNQVELITVRNYDDASLKRICSNEKVLIEQKTRRTAQIVRVNHSIPE